MNLVAPSSTDAPPLPGHWLEEVAAEEARDWASALGFSLARLARQADDRPLLVASSATWLEEGGWPYAQGVARKDSHRLLLVRTRDEGQALWALEEALKSGAVSGALAAAERPPFVMTRRLSFAASAGQAGAILLRPRPASDLSAARLRWRVSALPSASPPLDARSPGLARLTADLVRRKDGPPHTWMMEIEDETYRLRLAPGLAGDGLVAGERARAA